MIWKGCKLLMLVIANFFTSNHNIHNFGLSYFMLEPIMIVFPCKNHRWKKRGELLFLLVNSLFWRSRPDKTVISYFAMSHLSPFFLLTANAAASEWEPLALTQPRSCHLCFPSQWVKKISKNQHRGETGIYHVRLNRQKGSHNWKGFRKAFCWKNKLTFIEREVFPKI